MIKNENIICISSIDWDSVWQGHQEIMSTFAKAGNRVLFIENTGVRRVALKDAGRIKDRLLNWRRSRGGIRKAGENIYVFSPAAFPFPYSRVFRYINKYILLSVLRPWLKFMNFHDIIFWTYLPTPLSLDIIKSLNHKLSVYCCIDNLSLSSEGAIRVIDSEAQLIQQADLVFVSGKRLYEHCRQYRKQGLYIFREGVNVERFEKALNDSGSIPIDLKDITRPIIGYVGSIHKWLDLELIRYAAQSNPECSFVFVGPFYADVTALRDIKNIYFLGMKNKQELPGYIKEFKVCIIPYIIRDYTRNVYPTKLNEYLALGKPVISTSLPEVMYFNEENKNVVEICSSRDGFSAAINKILTQEDNAYDVNKRIEVARYNSWLARIEEMSKKIEEKLKELNQRG